MSASAETGRPRVLVREAIAEEGVELLRRRCDVDVDQSSDLDEIVGGYDALIVRSATLVSEALLERAVRLRVVGRAGVGVDNVDLVAATKRGIVVVNAPESTITSAAEHTLGLLFALARSIPQAHAALQEGRWERSRFGGIELADKTLGVIGLGRIGQHVARCARAIGMRVVAYDPYVAPERFRELGVEHAATVPDVLATADFVTLHATLTPETRGLIGRETLAAARPGLRIVNVGRGELIDEEALLAALADGTVAGAALDVFSAEPYAGPLLDVPNVITTPHLGASTGEAQSRAGVIVAEQVAAALGGGVVTNAVNVPAVSPEEMAQLGPFLPLAERLGELAFQLAGRNVTRLACSYRGQLATHDTRLLTLSALTGAFRGRMAGPVNVVNAPVVARERGIAVAEDSDEESPDFRNLIEVRAEAGGAEILVAGTTIGREHRARLVQALGYEIEIELASRMLFVVNEDQPGMIGHVGAVLGEAGVNIASMAVSRNLRRGDRALMVCTVDSDPQPEALGQIAAAPGIVEVRLIHLGD